MANLEDFGSVESESPFAEAIREHLELKARNSQLEGAVLDEALWTGRPRDFDWGD